jgi:hypothetical protein
MTTPSGAPQLGIMWEWDHARALDWSEYQYWMAHPLPFGWSITVEPQERAVAIEGTFRVTTRLEQLCAKFGLPPRLLSKPGNRH